MPTEYTKCGSVGNKSVSVDRLHRSENKVETDTYVASGERVLKISIDNLKNIESSISNGLAKENATKMSTSISDLLSNYEQQITKQVPSKSSYNSRGNKSVQVFYKI